MFLNDSGQHRATGPGAGEKTSLRPGALPSRRLLRISRRTLRRITWRSHL